MFHTLKLISHLKNQNHKTVVCSTVFNFFFNIVFLPISRLFKSIYKIFIHRDKKKDERRKEKLAMGKKVKSSRKKLIISRHNNLNMNFRYICTSLNSF